MYKKCLLIVISIMFVFISEALATMRTFSSGSYVIPVDRCWQPNNDPSTAGTVQTGCDTNKDDKSLFHVYGLLYALLDTGDDPDHPCTNKDGTIPFQKKILGYCKSIKVYWIIDSSKTNPQAPDLTISGSSTPLASIYHSPKTDTGTVNPLIYVGGPFVIDANDITTSELNAFMSQYPSAKIHKINVEFSGNVDKILLGKPPRVAVLDEGASNVLEDYLRASGLFSWKNYVFVPISASEIYNNPNKLDNFQLIWAPHWIVEDTWKDGTKPSVTQQSTVIGRIRNFLEAGNAGFFECASIESMEGSITADGSKWAGLSVTTGGFLISQTKPTPRIKTNGGCSDFKGGGRNSVVCTDPYLKFESAPFWLMQCGGWSYNATGGHVHNMRPNETNSNIYLTTKATDDTLTPHDDRYIGSQLTRFIHDDYSKLNGTYNPPSPYYVYDYLVGGRINGSPTQGYVVYFPGHKYIKCSNTEIPSPPERNLKLYFSHPTHSFVTGTIISVEIVHNLCTQGVNCPKADFYIDSQDGTTSVDANSYVDLDAAIYNQDTKTITSIYIGNKTQNNLTISKIIVTFPGNEGIPPDPPVKLDKIEDLSGTTPVTICTPNSASPANCGPISLVLGPFTSTCTIDWSSSNTCGIKYILNTLLALKYQITSSEFTKTQPIVKDNILFKASYDYPIYRGHLKMIRVPYKDPSTGNEVPASLIWDAANNMPIAGTSNFPSQPLSSNDASSPRYIFTNQPQTNNVIVFDPLHASSLKTYLNVATDNDAIVLINTVRGRVKASTADVYGSTSNCNLTTPDGNIDLYGCDEDTKRLWAFEHSTPALKVKSRLVESTTTVPIVPNRDRRDRIVFAGAADGMLHAFYAGTWDDQTGIYTNGTGREIWAYIPSALLPYLKNQPFNPDPTDYSTFEPAVSVDGSPALGDFLVCMSQDPTGTCTSWQWRTRLVGTAMVRSQNRGIIFALDVTDPYSPQLLWEKSYDIATNSKCKGNERNCNMGNSKGVAIGTVQVGTELKEVVFLTSSWINKKNPSDSGQDCSVNPGGCVYGISAFAIDISNGYVIWEKKMPYSGDAANINETPAIPSLMDIDNNGTFDYVVFGDFQGRIWALRTKDGENITGNEPVYTVKDSNGNSLGSAEPVGAPVSVYRDYVAFGTGGADYALNSRSYHLFVIKIGITGATEISVFTTSEGEKIWSKPVITRDLNIFVASARDYYALKSDVSTLNSSGRIGVLNLKSGTTHIIEDQSGNQWIQGGVVGGIDVDRKHAYAVLLKPVDQAGKKVDIIQIGADDFTATANTTNPFKVLWWKKL